MEPIFDEWNIYSKKKTLKTRSAKSDKLEVSSRTKIVAITGIRRCGKSSLLMLAHQRLLAASKKAGYVNLEDSRLKNNLAVLDDILKWFGDEGYLLLEEITSAKDWEGWLARNHEMLKGRLHLIVSSSRHGLLTPPKPLRGRILPHELYPLSFEEFLHFRGLSVEPTTAGRGRAEKLLEEYLVYGGFPEVVLNSDETDKVRLLNTYFKDIVALDVAEISGIEIPTVDLFGRYVIDATYFSASKALNFFKSAGFKIGKQGLLNLESYSQEGYLFFFVPIFSFNIKDRSQYPRKSYLGDTGFLNAISGKKNLGRLYENAVFLELKRRTPLNQLIAYWKDASGKEADFILMQGLMVKEIIQVVYELENDETKKREVDGLVACAREFGLHHGLILTKDVEAVHKVDGIEIRYLPLWKWLLS